MSKFIFLLSIVLFSITANSQNDNRLLNKKWKTGIFMGLYQPNTISKDDISTLAVISNSTGYTTGLFIEYSLTKNIVLSPKFAFSFGQSTVDFLIDEKPEKFTLMQLTPDISFDIMYKFDKKCQPYILAGTVYKIPINSNDSTQDWYEEKSSIGISLGLGLNKAFKYFITSPELKYAIGLNNISNHPAIKSLYYHAISLTVGFKG